MSVSAFAAAKHICRASDWTTSNLVLQKMLYLAHMSYLGQHSAALIEQPFEAWDYGPVIAPLYSRAKIFGDTPVRDVFYNEPEIASSPEGVMLTSAYNHLKDKSPGELIAITHWELGAWAKNYERGVKHKLIPAHDIIDEYNKRLSAFSKNDG